MSASGISAYEGVVRDDCSLGQCVEHLARVWQLAQGSVGGNDVVVDEGRLLCGGAHRDGEGVEAFGGVEGPMCGAAGFEEIEEELSLLLVAVSENVCMAIHVCSLFLLDGLLLAKPTN